MSAEQQDDDLTWQHGFDPEQNDGSHYVDEQDDTGQISVEGVIVPEKHKKQGKTKTTKSPGDKKQTAIIIGVAAAAAIGWIGYGILDGGHPKQQEIDSAMSPVSAIHLHGDARSHPVQDTVRQAPQPAMASPSMPTPAAMSAPAIPPMTTASLPMPAAPVGAASAVAPVVSATSVVASAALVTSSSSTEMSALKNQIVLLKSRIARESLQLSAAKSVAATSAAKPAPKIVYRVIYRDVPIASRPSPTDHLALHRSAASTHGIRVIGAVQGAAWLSIQGQHVMVHVGDPVPGLGIVQSISDNGVVRGSHGTARP